MTVVPREPGEARRRTGGMIAALGGATIVAGSFADWVRADISTVGYREGTGWRNVNGDVAHGPWFAAIGAVLIVIGACYLVGLRPRIARWLGAVLAIASVGLAIYELQDITKKVVGVTTTVQPGLWIIIVGGVVGLAGVFATAGAMPPPLPIRTPPLTPMPYPDAPPAAGDVVPPTQPSAPAPPAPLAPSSPPGPVGPLASTDPVLAAAVVASPPTAPMVQPDFAQPVPLPDPTIPVPVQDPTMPMPPQDPTLLG